MTYGQWLKNWLKVYKMPYVKNWKTIKRNIEIHIPESLKKTKLNVITAFDIQSALLSVKTSRVRVEIYDIYHGSLSMAYKVGFIDKDITTALIKPKHKRVVGSALTPGEVVAFRYLNGKTRNCAPSWVSHKCGSKARSKSFTGIARAMATQWQFD